MENATKALIIAGAILIAILLVTMGITLLSGTGGINQASQNQASQLEVQQFNGRLEGGIGTSVTGTNVSSMLEAAIAMKREDDSLELLITNSNTDLSNGTATISSTTSLADMVSMQSGISKTGRYVVTFTKDPASGLINQINFHRKTN